MILDLYLDDFIYTLLVTGDSVCVRDIKSTDALSLSSQFFIKICCLQFEQILPSS